MYRPVGCVSSETADQYMYKLHTALLAPAYIEFINKGCDISVCKRARARGAPSMIHGWGLKVRDHDRSCSSALRSRSSASCSCLQVSSKFGRAKYVSLQIYMLWSTPCRVDVGDRRNFSLRVSGSLRGQKCSRDSTPASGHGPSYSWNWYACALVSVLISYGADWY